MIAAVSLLWGGSFMFNAIAVRELPPLTIVLVRVGGAALALGLVMAALRVPIPAGLPWTDYAVMGVLANAIPFLLVVWAQGHITSGLAAVVNAATPICSVLIAHAAGVERATSQRLAGVMLGLAGVAVLIGPAALEGDNISTAGMLAVLAGTISYGLAALWGRRFQDVPPLVTSAVQLGFSTLILLPIAIAIDQPWTLKPPSWPTLGSLAALALLSTALAFVIFFKVMAEAGPLNAMLVSLLVPVSATGLAVVVLGETLTSRQVIGGAIIACALLVLDGRFVAWLKSRSKLLNR